MGTVAATGSRSGSAPSRIETGIATGGLAAAAMLLPSQFTRAPAMRAAYAVGIGAIGFGVGAGLAPVVSGIVPGHPLASAAAGAGIATVGLALARQVGKRSPLAAGVLGLAAAAVGGASVASAGLQVVGASGIGGVVPGGRLTTAAAATVGTAAVGLAALKFTGHMPVRPTLAGAARDVLGDPALLSTIDKAAATGNVAARALRGREAFVQMTGDASEAGWKRLGTFGQRFLQEGATADEITRATGRPATEPVRVYVGHAETASMKEQVRVALDRAERTGALDKGNILVVQPMVDGMMNMNVPLSAELLTGGDVATFVLQPTYRSVARELPNLRQAGVVHRQLVDELAAQLKARGNPANIYVQGLCFGGMGSLQGLGREGVDAIAAHGVTGAYYTGIPGITPAKQRILDAALETGDERVLLAHSTQELRDARAAGATPRVIFQDSFDDPFARVSGRGVVSRVPARPGDAQAPFVPGVTWLNELLDPKGAARGARGTFLEAGHDYRASAPDGMALLLGTHDDALVDATRTHVGYRESERLVGRGGRAEARRTISARAAGA